MSVSELRRSGIAPRQAENLRNQPRQAHKGYPTKDTIERASRSHENKKPKNAVIDFLETAKSIAENTLAIAVALYQAIDCFNKIKASLRGRS